MRDTTIGQRQPNISFGMREEGKTMSDMEQMKQITDSRKAELFDSAMDSLLHLLISRDLLMI